MESLQRRLARQLEDGDDPTTKSLLSCGSAALDQLRQAIREPPCTDSLSKLIELAVKEMPLVPSNLCWRRLYTDASLFLIFAKLGENFSSTTCLECISILDRIIIISGAPGQDRLDLTLDIINKIQSNVLATTLHYPELSFPIPPPVALQPILRLDEAPSFSSFNTKLFQEPFILRGYALSWPAMQEHPWSSLQYLRAMAGPGRVVPVEVGKDYRRDDWTQRIMNWDDFLASLSSSTEGETRYLAQHDLFKQFPALRSDIVVPDYVYASLPYPDKYEPPCNEENLIINAWLGPAHTLSPAHTDPYYNFYAQVVGYKTVWLAPPSVSALMKHVKDGIMSNTSQLDVFDPLMDEAVNSRALSAVLEPGDCLFFPPGWWHAMRSESTSFSVSMWF